MPSVGRAKPKKAKAKYPGLYEDHLFDEFWSNYPLRIGKKKAWETWLRLAPHDRELAAGAAIEYGAIFSKATPDRKQYIPHPTSWLNARSFEDDREVWRLKAGSPTPPARKLPAVGTTSPFANGGLFAPWTPEDDARLRRRGDE